MTGKYFFQLSEKGLDKKVPITIMISTRRHKRKEAGENKLVPARFRRLLVEKYPNLIRGSFLPSSRRE